MNITELAVRRPTAIVVALVLFLALGLAGYTSLGADLFPAANTPIIAIQTSYPGAGAEEIENEVIKPLEDAVATISGLDKVRSTSGDGYGYMILQFTMSTEANAALLDVQKALDGMADQLPQEAAKPTLYKYDINMQPMLTLSLSGAIPYEQLCREAKEIKEHLERLPGVGNVTLEGNREQELAVKLDKHSLEFYGINASTVVERIQAENLNVPAGKIRQETRDQMVRVLGEYQSVEEVKNLFIPYPGGKIKLGEIAEISLAYPAATTLVRLNGQQSIGILIRKQSDANVVATANLVKKEINALAKSLPAESSLTVVHDATTFINDSLRETKRNLVEGIITTSIVLFLFLRQWRSSLIVLIAIPASLISTCFFMYIFNFTFNIVSLLGLALCVGILVDDSIVVLENIHRHLALGKRPLQAAVDGRMEIGMAAIAITLCDVVVFAPIAFMGDMVGQFFRQFGLTVVVATLFSLLVSFTLTPLMASRLPGATAGEKERERRGLFEKFFAGTVVKLYGKALHWALRNRCKVIGLVLLGIIATVSLIPSKVIGTEFLPVFDQSRLEITLNLAPGSNLQKTDAEVKEVERYLRTLPEVQDYFSIVGIDYESSSATISINLTDKTKRTKSESQVANEIRAWGNNLAGVEFAVTEPSVVSRTSIDGSKPIILNLTGTDRTLLAQLAADVEELVKAVPGVVDVDNSLQASQPEIQVRINRPAAADFGLTLPELAATVRTAIAGQNAGVLRQGNQEHDIVVKYLEQQVKTIDDIGALKILTSSGNQVFLNQVANLAGGRGPQELLRMNKQQVVTIAANIQGRPLGIINEEIKAKLQEVTLPAGYAIQFGGEQENMATSFDSLLKALIASVVLVYLILVVLYESYLTPLIRMLALPCGLIGALAALAITGKSLNIISLIGLIMLDGLASKNGTLLIDYTNTLLKRGMPLQEALVEAGTTRLRPIVMTSATMIVGMLPLALSLGAGSELKSGMAIALIGGLVSSTLLTPLLLPVVYSLIGQKKQTILQDKSSALG